MLNYQKNKYFFFFSGFSDKFFHRQVENIKHVYFFKHPEAILAARKEFRII